VFLSEEFQKQSKNDYQYAVELPPMKAKNGLSLGSALGALGIVYGDIGTSVLYAFKACLAHSGRHQREILGILLPVKPRGQSQRLLPSL
jgi:K+ transporter